MDRLFRVNNPTVAANCIDGKAVMVNLKSGNYRRAESTGGKPWRLIEDGLTYGQMIDPIHDVAEVGWPTVKPGGDA